MRTNLSSHAQSVNDKHTKTSCIRCTLIIVIKLHVALQYLMASNVERESGEGREETLRRRREHNSLKRERETAEERHSRFVNTNLSLITFCDGI